MIILGSELDLSLTRKVVKNYLRHLLEKFENFVNANYNGNTLFFAISRICLAVFSNLNRYLIILSVFTCKSGLSDEYQSCSKYCDLYSSKISDFSNLYSPSYGQDIAALFSEKLEFQRGGN